MVSEALCEINPCSQQSKSSLCLINSCLQASNSVLCNASSQIACKETAKLLVVNNGSSNTALTYVCFFSIASSPIRNTRRQLWSRGMLLLVLLLLSRFNLSQVAEVQ